MIKKRPHAKNRRQLSFPLRLAAPRKLYGLRQMYVIGAANTQTLRKAKPMTQLTELPKHWDDTVRDYTVRIHLLTALNALLASGKARVRTDPGPIINGTYTTIRRLIIDLGDTE